MRSHLELEPRLFSLRRYRFCLYQVGRNLTLIRYITSSELKCTCCQSTTKGFNYRHLWWLFFFKILLLIVKCKQLLAYVRIRIGYSVIAIDRPGYGAAGEKGLSFYSQLPVFQKATLSAYKKYGGELPGFSWLDILLES